jgi:outer membrane biosynthesis protein TonB
MSDRLSLATVATYAVLAATVFGGAYALAHDSPAAPAPAPASPTAIRLAHDPIGTLHRVSPLPALIVPRPRPRPVQPQPVVTVPTPQVPAQAAVPPVSAPQPAPAPAPRPRPRPAPAKKPPQTFDDSG